MSFSSLRNSNLHLLSRKWCRCLFASLLAAASLGLTVCLEICHLNPDLRTLAKQRKTALVSVIYISAFAKVLGFFSSWSRSSWLVLYYKGVIKPNEMESQCPTMSGYSHSLSEPREVTLALSSPQIIPTYSWGQTVLGELLPPSSKI